GQCDQRIASSDFRAVNDFAFFHHAHAEAGQVVVFTFIHTGHFGGFAAYQRAAGQFAAHANAGHYSGRHIDVEFAGGVVVEEEQRLGTADHQVVDAHGHQVLADAVVLVQVQRQAQLG